MPKVRKRIRVNMRMPPDLVLWAKKYAKETDRNFTQLVILGLNLLYERDSKRNAK